MPKYYWTASGDASQIKPGFKVPPAPPRQTPVEKIFERVRREEYPDRPSRLGAIYVCPSLKGFCQPGQEDWETGQPEYIFEVRVQGKTFTTDGEAFTEARMSGNAEIVESWANTYWSSTGMPPFFPEVLVDGTVTVIRRIQPRPGKAAAQRVAARYIRQAGLVKPPPAMLQAAQDWVESQIISGLLWEAQQELKDPYTYHEPGEIEKRIRYLESMISTRVRPKKLKNVRKKMPLNLDGWPYKKQVLEHSLALTRIQREMPEYNLRLTQDPLMGGGAAAYWDSDNKTLAMHYVFNMGAMGLFKMFATSLAKLLDKVETSLRHEMVHLTQSLLIWAFGDPKLEERLDLGGTQPMPGLPSSVSMTPEFMQELTSLTKREQRKYKKLVEKVEAHLGWGGETIHRLDDVEFYSRLSDEVRNFNAKYRDLHDPADRKSAFVRWVAGTSRLKKKRGLGRPTLRPPSGASDTFVVWRSHAPGKWKKAVKEMAKAVL